MHAFRRDDCCTCTRTGYGLPAAKFPRFLRARKVSACQEEASTPPVAATALVAGLFTPLFIIFRADHHSSDTRQTLPGDSPWGIGVRFYHEVGLPGSGNGSSVTQEGGFRGRGGQGRWTNRRAHRGTGRVTRATTRIGWLAVTRD